MLEDLDLGSWDIKFIKTPSLSTEIEKKLENLQELDNVMANAKLKWDEIEEIQKKAFREFNQLVKKNMLKRGIIKE